MGTGSGMGSCTGSMGMSLDMDGGFDAGGGRATATTWVVSLTLRSGRRGLAVKVPRVAAADEAELRLAIAESCLVQLGAEVMPASWLDENKLSARMGLQYVTAAGKLSPLSDGGRTPFAEVRAAEMLRASELR